MRRPREVRRRGGVAASRSLLAAALLLSSRAAPAFEIPLPFEGRTLRIAINQTLISEYHMDQDVLVGNPTDKYLDFKNRSDLTLMHGTTTFNLRFDFNLFAATDDGSIHEDRISLEKISLSNIQRRFEVTAGDFHIRVGRGLALDLTRVDEIIRDTTLRGGLVKLRTTHVDGTIFGGWVNPLEVDDLTETPVRVPSDVIAGGRIEVRPVRQLSLGLHYTGGGLQSQHGASRDATHIIGASMEMPDLVDRLSIYGEFNFMSRAQDQEVAMGYGTYLSATGNFGPLAALLEFKFYQRFQFINDFGTEVDTFVYNRPPTLMWQKQEVINNHDVIGPRLRLDYHVASWRTTFWVSYGHFFRSDSATNEGFFDKGATVNDVFGGLQVRLTGGALDLTGGYRIDTLSGNTQSITDYSQAFGEAELSVQIYRHHSVELEIIYRNVEKTAEKFWDFHVSVGYRPSKYFSGGFTYEFTNEFPDPDPTDEVSTRRHFGGVRATVNFTSSSFVRAFGGTTRGGARCIDGFCREFPPFVGLKLETVVMF